MKFEGIMKVQLPVQIIGDDTEPVGMAYDKSRKFSAYFDPAIVMNRMGEHFPESHKGFFHCTISDDNVLAIGAKAKWQNW